jgi:hypothetical protein
MALFIVLLQRQAPSVHVLETMYLSFVKHRIGPDFNLLLLFRQVGKTIVSLHEPIFLGCSNRIVSRSWWSKER